MQSGINFSGKIGVRGSAGIEYSGTLYRTFASANVSPVAQISGYAEAGVNVIGIFGLGVGGQLTFVKGDLDLQAFVGIWSQNSEKIVLAYTYAFEYDIELLKGKLYAYAEACSPIPLPFVDDCVKYTHDIFTWSGYDKSGVIAADSKTFVIANL